MARASRSIHARKKRRKLLKEARGYWGTKHTSYKRAKEQVWKSGVYAYVGRKQKSGTFGRCGSSGSTPPPGSTGSPTPVSSTG